MPDVRDNPPPTGSIGTLGGHFEFWVLSCGGSVVGNEPLCR